MAIRRDWLQPEDVEVQKELVAISRATLGEAAVRGSRLFPRAFSLKLRSSDGSKQAPRSLSKRRWNKGSSSASSDVTFTSEPAEAAAVSPNVRGLRYLVVLDLEGKDEITEFPVIVLDTTTRCELGRFQRYVRPAHLFDGCELVSDSPAIPFPAVLQEFDEFLLKVLGTGRSLASLGNDAAFLTCGDWDCKHVHAQCRISGIPVPVAFARWVNVKRTYDDAYGGSFRGMRSMLAKLGLLDASGVVVHGFHHLGMHDVENICRCVLRLLQEGHGIAVNGQHR